MMKLIDDNEWLRLSIRYIEDEWWKLLMMNDSNYWRWVNENIVWWMVMRLMIKFNEDE
jgi:hypothetical protein